MDDKIIDLTKIDLPSNEPTIASSFIHSVNIKSIKKIGKIDDYYGVKFNVNTKTGNPKVQTFSLNSPHNGHGWHWQLNKINPQTGSIGSRIRWDVLFSYFF